MDVDLTRQKTANRVTIDAKANQIVSLFHNKHKFLNFWLKNEQMALLVIRDDNTRLSLFVVVYNIDPIRIHESAPESAKLPLHFIRRPGIPDRPIRHLIDILIDFKFDFPSQFYEVKLAVYHTANVQKRSLRNQLSYRMPSRIM